MQLAWRWENHTSVGRPDEVVVSDVGIDAGLSRFPSPPAEPVAYTPEHRETLVVLEGTARVDIAGVPRWTSRRA